MKPFVLSLLALALTGCAAVGPDFKEPVPAAPRQLSDWHGGPAALRDTGLPIGGTQAFARFGDPVLLGLQQQALAANHDLAAASLRFAQSRAMRNATAGAAGPQLSAHAGAVRQRQSESGAGTRMVDAIAPANREALVGKLSSPFDLFQAGFDASWEIDLWGRIRRGVEASDAAMAEASSLLREVQLSVVLEVARNYYELRLAQRQQALLAADLAAAEDGAGLVRSRRKGGLAGEQDVLRADALVAELRGRLPAQLEAEAQAANRLTLLTAGTPGALQAMLAPGGGAGGAAAGAAPFGAAPDLALGVASDVVAHRPDIQAAEARLHAATARIGVARAELYPRITLGLSYGLESLSESRFGDWGSRQWSAGPSLQLPLFDNGRRRATVELRELEQQEAAIHYQETVLKAWHEMDNALSAYAAERQRHKELQVREASQRAALELATIRHRQGLADAQPVLEAQRALLAVQRERLNGEAQQIQRLLAICKASATLPEGLSFSQEN